jgi:GTP-binding protein
VDQGRLAETIAWWSERLGPEVPVIATSSASGSGLGQLAGELSRAVPALSRQQGGERHALSSGPSSETLAEHMVFRPAAREGFRVQRSEPGRFTVTGNGIERLLARFDVDNEDAMAYVEGRLRRIGVLSALQREGFEPGDEIEIAGIVFELDPQSPS